MMFRLKKYWVIDGVQCNLWNEIISGRKTEEYRDATPYWWKRLFGQNYESEWSKLLRSTAIRNKIDLKIRKDIDKKKYGFSFIGMPKIAKFTIGYPRNNLPRIEADIQYVKYLSTTNQLAVGIANIRVIGGD